VGGKSQTQTSQQSTTPYNLAGLQSIFNQVQGAASTPYTPYGGQLTAGVNNQQNLGIANVNANANSGQPYFGQASQYAATGAAPITAQSIQNYQNPFNQSVIDATQAQFNEGNGIQQQQVKGNAALAGALGGSRQAVAQAETARQQQLAQAPVIAGLNQANYTQALGAAQADRSAAGNAAGLYGNLGTAAQTAGLQGAAAQIGAGTLQQQTEQAGLNAQYQQYLQAQGFPYAQAQFLAQYGIPAATAQGASTSGTQTTPGPNPFSQLLGLGTAALTAYSSEKVKENIEQVGKTFDGQPVYRFNYIGSPMTQIGLIAEKVERKHPIAVGESHGIKTVNYADATDDAVQRGHFASGGIVGNDSPFNFIANGVDFIPKGGGAPSGQLNAPTLQFAKPPSDTESSDLGRLLGTAGRTYRNSGSGSGGWGATSTGAEGVGGLGGLYADGGLVDAIHHIHSSIKRSRGGAVGGSPFRTFANGGATFDDRWKAMTDSRAVTDDPYLGSQPLRDFMSADSRKSTGWEPVPPMDSAQTKRVLGYAGGGEVSAERLEAGRIARDPEGAAWRLAQQIARRGYADGGAASFDDRFDAAFPSMSGPAPAPAADPSASPFAFDSPSFTDTPYRLAGPEAMDTWRKGVDTPNPALGADVSPAPGRASPVQLPPQITGPQQDDDGQGSALAFDGSRSPLTAPGGALPPGGGAPQAGAAPVPESRFGSLNPFGLSDKTREAIVAGALGVAASRSPFALSAIGEGGLHGLKAYNEASAAEQAAAERKLTQEQNQRRIDLEAARLAQSITQFNRTQSETERYHKATEDRTKYVPAGSIIGENGVLRPAVMEQSTGRIIDPVTGKPVDPDAKVIAKGAKAPVSDEDARALAEYYVKTGDASRLNGMGITGEARQKVQHYVTLTQKDMNVTDEELATRKAEWEGRKAGQRTLGVQEAKMGSAAFEAEGAIKQARGVIERLPRTSFLPFNQLLQGASNKTLNPDQTELYGRAQAIVNTYAAVMARGANVTTDSARGHAEELLNTAGNPATFNRMLDTMLQEIEMAKHSPAKMREFYRNQYGAKAVDESGAAGGGGGGGSSPAAAAPDRSGWKFNPKLKQYRDASGRLFDENGKPISP
jgi:hypothetical protein